MNRINVPLQVAFNRSSVRAVEARERTFSRMSPEVLVQFGQGAKVLPTIWTRQLLCHVASLIQSLRSEQTIKMISEKSFF